MKFVSDSLDEIPSLALPQPRTYHHILSLWLDSSPSASYKLVQSESENRKVRIYDDDEETELLKKSRL